MLPMLLHRNKLRITHIQQSTCHCGMFMFFTASLQFLSEDIIVISGKRILKLLAIDVRRYHKRAG